MPFANYEDWNDCISKNQDKDDPEAYCGSIKHKVEGDLDASQCVFKRMDCLEKKYPNMFDLRTKLTMSYDYCNSDLKERQDFGNGLFFTYVEDLVGRNKLKKLLDYQKVKSIWNDIRIIQSPRLVDKENGIGRIGKLYLKKFQNDLLTEDASNNDPNDPNKLLGQKEGNMPLEPVMSSNVMARGVADNKLYVRFHSSPSNTYKYEFDSNQEALQAAEEMVNESPGRWVWENLRGHQAGSKVTPNKLGQAWGSKNLTIGGIGSSGYVEHPYEKIGLVIQKIDEVPGMEETAKKLRKFKTEVKAKGEGAESAEPIRPEELKEYQEEIYKEKEKRKVVNEEVKGMIEKLRSKALNRDMIVEDSDYPKSKGKWVTIKGRHIFVPEGQELQFEKDGTFKVSGDDNNKEVKKKSGNDVKDRNALRERIRYLRNKLQDESLKKPERKEINDEIVKLRKMLKGFMFNKDFLVEDSMDALVQWVLAKKLTTDPKEAEEIAFAIANSNKKSKQQSQIQAKKSTIQEVGESYSKSQEKEWSSTWSEIGEAFTKQRVARKTSKADLTEEALLEDISSILGELEKYDFNIDDLKDFLTQDVITKILDEHGAESKQFMVKAIAPAREPDYIYIKYLDEKNEEHTIEVDSSKILELAKDIEARTKRKGVDQKTLKDIVTLIHFYISDNDLITEMPDEIEESAEYLEDPSHPLVLEDVNEFLMEEFFNLFEPETYGEESEDIFREKLNSLLEHDNVSGLLNIIQDKFLILGKNKPEEWKNELKNDIEALHPKGKGKGWFGESERHSKAKLTGKADLIETEVENLNG